MTCRLGLLGSMTEHCARSYVIIIAVNAYRGVHQYRSQDSMRSFHRTTACLRWLLSVSQTNTQSTYIDTVDILTDETVH